jgi:hypothetical protein
MHKLYRLWIRYVLWLLGRTDMDVDVVIARMKEMKY